MRLDVCRICRKRCGEVLKGAGKIVLVLPQQRPDHAQARWNRSARPGAQRSFGIADVSGVALRHGEVEIAPRERFSSGRIVRARRCRCPQRAKFTRDWVSRLEREPFQDLVVGGRDEGRGDGRAQSKAKEAGAGRAKEVQGHETGQSKQQVISIVESNPSVVE